MTRINIIPVQALSDKHLGAEYRELPRVFGAVRKKVDAGFLPESLNIPGSYRLGEGHVTFFYDKLGYLLKRYSVICNECLVRGRRVNYNDSEFLTDGIPSYWFGDWEPSAADIEINLSRIAERGGLRFGTLYGISLIISKMTF